VLRWQHQLKRRNFAKKLDLGVGHPADRESGHYAGLPTETPNSTEHQSAACQPGPVTGTIPTPLELYVTATEWTVRRGPPSDDAEPRPARITRPRPGIYHSQYANTGQGSRPDGFDLSANYSPGTRRSARSAGSGMGRRFTQFLEQQYDAVSCLTHATWRICRNRGISTPPTGQVAA